jgi:hypothetical protein
MPVSVGGRGGSAAAPSASGTAADCLERIDRQSPVAQRDRTSAVVGGAQVGIGVWDGYLHSGGFRFAGCCSGGDDLVGLVAFCAASCGSGRRSLHGVWRGLSSNDLARRPPWAGGTPTHSHSGQFMTSMKTKHASLFGHGPPRLGPAACAPGRPTTGLGPSPFILMIGSSPAVITLATASSGASLVVSPRWFSPDVASARGTR